MQCCPSHLISSLIQRDACAGPVAVLRTGINYVFTTSYDQPIFYLSVSVRVRICMHQAWAGARVSIGLS